MYDYENYPERDEEQADLLEGGCGEELEYPPDLEAEQAVDVPAICEACKEAINGPHGGEVVAVIKYGLGIGGGLVALDLTLKFVERLIRLKMRLPV